jgi:hypothetical protein
MSSFYHVNKYSRAVSRRKRISVTHNSDVQCVETKHAPKNADLRHWPPAVEIQRRKFASSVLNVLMYHCWVSVTFHTANWIEPRKHSLTLFLQHCAYQRMFQIKGVDLGKPVFYEGRADHFSAHAYLKIRRRLASCALPSFDGIKSHVGWIWGSQSGDYKVQYVLGYEDMWSGII